jgi:hypothetical protein
MKQFTATCAFCGHKCLRNAFDSIFPEDVTSSKDIFIGMGGIRFSLLCSSPACRKYTITCIHSQDREDLSEKYKLKDPSETD